MGKSLEFPAEILRCPLVFPIRHHFERVVEEYQAWAAEELYRLQSYEEDVRDVMEAIITSGDTKWAITNLKKLLRDYEGFWPELMREAMAWAKAIGVARLNLERRESGIWKVRIAA